MGKKSCKLIVVLLAVLPALLSIHAKDKKQPSLPAVFNQAHTVYVEAVDGREFDPNLYPADREAIADVRDALRAWNRYVFTTEREQADLIFVVRKGRIADGQAGGGDRGQITQEGQMGAQIPGTQRREGPMGDAGAGAGGEAGGEVGAANDLFEVCQMKANGKLSGPLWTRSLRGGLDSPRLILFQQFKEAVERAYPSPPAGQTAKP